MKKLLLLSLLAFLSFGLFAQENFGGISVTDSSSVDDKLAIEQSDSTRAIMKKYLYDGDTLYLAYDSIYVTSVNGKLKLVGDSIDLSGIIKFNDAVLLADAAELNILNGALFSTQEGNYLVGVTSAIQGQIDSKLAISDTSSMLDKYIRAAEVAASYLALVDTSSMLDHYIQRSDTSDMLANYIRAAEVAASYLALADTSSMLDKYIREAEVANTYAPLANPDFTGNVNIAPRTDPVSTDEGDLYYDSDVDSLYLRVNSTWVALNREAGGGSMTYPGSGIAVSSGSAWATSITNSSELAGNISDETGTGALVFGTSPTFTTQITIGSGVITAAEAGYIDPTSSIQTQIDAKADIANETHTGTTTINYALLDSTKIGTNANSFGFGDLVKNASNEWFILQGSDTLNPGFTSTGTESLSDHAVMLTDPKLQYQFGAGLGLAGDTALMNNDNDLGFGHFPVHEDSLEVTQIDYYLSSGDTLGRIDVVYGTINADASTTVTDTIVTINATDGKNSITSFDVSTIPESTDIWLDIGGVVATRKPILFWLDLIGYIKRD